MKNNINLLSKDEVLDITDPDIQNNLLLLISNFFIKNEVSIICDELVDIKLFITREISNQRYILYEKQFDSGNYICISDMMDVDIFPYIRYIEIYLGNNTTNIVPTIKKYSHTKYFYDIINGIITKAYNYKYYRNFMDTTIKESTINNNFAKQVFHIIPENDLSILTTLDVIINHLSFDKSFISRDAYFKLYSITDTLQIEISSRSDKIMKFQVNNKSIRMYIFIERSIKGCTMLSIIMQDIYTELTKQ